MKRAFVSEARVCQAFVKRALPLSLSQPLYIPLHGNQVGLHYRAIDQSGNTHVRDLGRAHLAPLPHGAIIVSPPPLPY